MTELEWLSCTDPQLMLDFLRGKVSDRKLRLFAVACCRGVWDQLTDERSRRAIEVAEQYADVAASSDALRAAYDEAPGGWPAANLATSAAMPVGSLVADWAAQNYLQLIVSRVKKAVARTRRASGHRLCSFLRDLFGPLPFRPVTVAPSWLTWSDGTVLRLARSIYDNHTFRDLPILTDALEDSGCTDPAILEHLRGPGPHVRGCHVVDALLGRE